MRPDPSIGEYDGLPINDAARYHAAHWCASLWTVPEHQCIPHPPDYGPTFSPVRIWRDVNPLTQETVALYTWEGFSTGRWQGDVLVVTTTHLKPGHLRRNGIPRSDLSHWAPGPCLSDDPLEPPVSGGRARSVHSLSTGYPLDLK